MGIELAKAFVKVRGDVSQLPGDLNQAERITTDSIQNSSRAANKAISDAQTNMLSAISAGKAAAAGLLGIFAAMGKGFLQRGLFSAGQFEQTTIAFETMIGSASETKKTLADLTTFAAKTPFEMPEILQAARGLIQFGERGDDMMETLNILGEAAAGTSQPFGMLALIFNQVRGVGKLLTQDFRQLSTRGVISLQDIADHFNTTTAAAQKMLSGGKVTFEEFRKILKAQTQEGGRFFNLMQRQSQSFLGLISTLKDGWNILGRELAGAIIPVAKQVVAITIKAVDAGLEFVKANKMAASAALVGAVAFATLGASILAASVATKVFSLTWTQLAIKIGLVSGLVSGVLAAGASIGWLVGKNWEWIRSMVEASGILTWFRDTGVAVWTAVSEWAVRKMNEIKAWFDENKAVLSEIWFLTQETALNAWDTIKNVWSGLADFFSGLYEIISFYLGEMLTSVLNFTGLSDQSFLQWTRDILDGLSLLSTHWGLTWDWMKMQARISFLIIAEAAMVLWDTLKAGVKAAGVTIFEIMKAMYDNIYAMTLNFINKVIYGFQTIGQFLKSLWQAIVDDFTGVNDDFFQAFRDDFNKNMAEIAKEFDTPETIRKVNPLEVFNEEFSKNLGSDNPLKAQIDEAKAASDSLLESMKMIRDAKRTERGFGEGILLPGGKVRSPEEAAKKAKEEAGAGGAEFLKPERVGIAALGTKLQDLFLKGDKDRVQKDQLDVAKKHLKIGADQLEELKKTKGLGLVADVGTAGGGAV